uniref:Bardet-Biedl syndrome 1 N-terminal domain-containing protein n=1 Tax=Chromulina nebulosa TaxID=96789 RepID=A0A7S0XEZ2_9STRA|mmetsp:Transcript_5003/g.4494  ORF Transcript_5003/g.4494 Transcript_5003/m.4494 type:complete len:595 (+) Transcript_5003:19-1803(+)
MEEKLSARPKHDGSPFLDAWYDPLSNLRTTSACVRLGDINGDGDTKLIICENDKRLKVYKGTTLSAECQLLASPVAVAVIYNELSVPRIPSIAVAAGSHVFIYRQLRPYRKWVCPPVDVDKTELEIWTNLKNDSILPTEAVKSLAEARDNGVNLSSRSLDLLGLEIDTARATFITEMKDAPFNQHTLITCMDVLKKDSEEPESLCHLIVGTESKYIYVLPIDQSNSNILCKVKLPSPPALMSVTGVFDVEWRISVACRDGMLYTIRQGDVRGTALLSGVIVDLTSQAVAMVKQDKLLWIATMDRVVSCYTIRGKRSKSIVFNEDVVDLAVITVRRSKVSHLLVVAMASGEIKFYRDAGQVYALRLDKPVIAMRFGSYGREENSIVFIHGRGSITVKIWKRSADIDNFNPPSGPPPEQDIPLPIPKKTKLYVDQTQRERDQAPSMHRAFHKDLCRLRLETARAYVKTLTEGYMGATPLGSADIRIQVQVLGLGPSFVLKITLQNSGSQPLNQARMLFNFESELYMMGHNSKSKQCIALPSLLPGVKHIQEASILNIDPQGRSGNVLIIIHHPTSSSSLPMLSASVKMPVSELLDR